MAWEVRAGKVKIRRLKYHEARSTLVDIRKDGKDGFIHRTEKRRARHDTK